MPRQSRAPLPRAERKPVSFVAAAAGLVTLYFVWGSTYLAIALVIETMPPLLTAGVRFALAGVLVLAWCWARGSFRAERPTLRQWGSATIVGGLLLLGGNGLVNLAELRIPTGVTALLVGTLPIWMVVLDAAVTRRGVSKLVIIGLLGGIAGVAILVVPGADLSAIEPIGALMALGSSVVWAVGSLYARGARLPRTQLLSTGMQMLTGGALLAIAGAAMGEFGTLDVDRFSTESLLALAYLVVAGSLLAFSVYAWLLQNVATSTVATYAYVNPVVAVVLGWLVLAEPITLRTIVAAAIIIGSVAAMVSGRPHASDPSEEAGPAHPAVEPAAPGAGRS